MRYAVWNNKGGVGKTFITFVMAAEYASAHPDKKVVAIDMCPQANVSEILLGGNGKGADTLSSLLAKNPRQTIGGYFDQRITQPHAKTGTEINYLVDVFSFNDKAPKNVYLVAGDPSLELQAQAINQIAAQSLPADAWKNSWVLDLVEAITAQHPSAVFFIDCNPSFSAYTELALVAADRLIIPCTADGSSARAIDNVGQLLYGVNVPPSYATANFEAKAKNYGMSLPYIHLVPLNRSTQYDKKASRAFGAMYEEIKNRIATLQTKIPKRFSLPTNLGSAFLDIPDAHSVSVVASHLGLPLGDIRVRRYNVHGTPTQVNEEPLDRYKTALKELVALL
jgi:cellulose biosynthesis protein BcsQ